MDRLDVSVLQGVASFVNVLNISDNRLTNLDFLQLPWSSLRTLDLSHNGPLHTLPADAFQGMRNLQELHLKNTGITVIESGAFNNLASLQRLYLDDNRIRVGVFLKQNKYINK